MAERRMISKSIADTDKFLDMPLSTQALYFHLVLRADDDGFIGNPKRILKIIGGSDDDFKILISKGYVLIFESGIIVITHWNQYNHVTKDRYKKTVYSDERKRLKIEKNKVYSLVYTDCIQSGYNVDTQYSPEEISISKKSIDQIKPDQPIQPSVTNMGGAEGTECSQADYDNYLGIIKKNIDYETLIKSSRNSPWYKRQLDEIINIIADVVTFRTKPINIGSNTYSAEMVKSQFLKLNYDNISYVMEYIRSEMPTITNPKSYLTAVLFNSRFNSSIGD